MAGTAPGTPAPTRPASPTRTAFRAGYRSGGGSGVPTRTGAAGTAGRAAAGADNAAGFVLALVFWGWIALPFLKNGPTGVRNTLRAKFFNKAADGSWLP